MGPLFFISWTHSWVNQCHHFSKWQSSCTFHRPLTPLIFTLLIFTCYLSRQVGKLTSGFRKTHTGLSRKEIITQSLFIQLPTLFCPFPIYLVHWAKVNFLKYILEYVAMDTHILSLPEQLSVCPAPMSAQAITCPPLLLTQWLSGLSCLRHSLGSSGQQCQGLKASGANPNSKGW